MIVETAVMNATVPSPGLVNAGIMRPQSLHAVRISVLKYKPRPDIYNPFQLTWNIASNK
jgi:hypothetical protein